MTGPVHVIRFGLIKCQIFQRSTGRGDRHYATVVRLFRNGDKWVESKQFGRDDLPLVVKVIDLAHTWIYIHCQTEAGQSKEKK